MCSSGSEVGEALAVGSNSLSSLPSPGLSASELVGHVKLTDDDCIDCVTGELVFLESDKRRSETRAQQQRRLEAETLGGLRRASVSAGKLDCACALGVKVKLAYFKLFRRKPELVKKVVLALGKDTVDGEFTVEDVRDCTEAFVGAIGAPDLLHEFDLGVRHDLLSAWRIRAQDPDDQVELWLRDGAPMGLRVHPLSRGIFPLHVSGMDRLDPEDIVTDPSWLDEGTELQTSLCRVEFDKFEKAGFVVGFDSLDELELYLGEPAVLSHVRLISRERGGKVKHRPVFDARASGISSASSNIERVLLPRALDVVQDALEAWRETGQKHPLQFLVIDFSDAFWQIPIMSLEKKFFTTKVGDRYFVLQRAAQGSRAGPLLWARLAAMIMRMTQCILGVVNSRLACYVDDPILTLACDETTSSYHVALVVCLWRVLGLPLAFRKAQFGTHVTWTSIVKLSCSVSAWT